MANELSSKEQEKLILANQKLVPYLVNKLRIPPSEFDDMLSLGRFGLIKAAKTFDKSKKITFATYASWCIYNEIFMYLRKKNNKKNVISLNDPIFIDKNGNELTFEDTISDPIDFTEQIAIKEGSIYLINIILNYFEPRERLIMLYTIAGFKQEEIAGVLSISRSYVSRLQVRLINELKDTFQGRRKVTLTGAFSMSIVGEAYKISFYSKDVKSFNKIFSTFLKNLTSVANLPNFQVSSENQQIKILVPANPESFLFIAQIFQEIDKNNITSTFHEKALTEDNKVSDVL